MAESKSHLDALPPELQTLIMTHTSSLQSLYALIKTSTHFYHVFSLSKQRILSAIIHNLLHPEVLPDAQAAAFLTRRKPPLTTRGDMLAFTKTYHNDRKKAQVTEQISLTMCVTICQLHRSVEYFLRDFVDRCATFSAQQGFPLNVDSLPLSWTEEGRIQRALYRLHLYGRIFYSNVDDLRGLHASEQAEFFFWKFPTYQRGELFFLRNYFYQRLSDAYDRIEDGYVESVLAEISGSDESEDEERKRSNDSERNEYSDGSTNHGRPVCYGLFDRWNSFEFKDEIFFSKEHKNFHLHYIGNQIAAGLPSLRQFFEADSNEQTNVVQKFRFSKVDSLVCALLYRPQSFVNLKEISFSKNDLEKPNEAYLWENSYMSQDWYDCSDANGLRQCGYYFWDRMRLELSGMIAEYDTIYPFNFDIYK